jgi:hypothetical protein
MYVSERSPESLISFKLNAVMSKEVASILPGPKFAASIATRLLSMKFTMCIHLNDFFYILKPLLLTALYPNLVCQQQ